MRLAREDFARVVEHTPLVSIDLIVRDPRARVLVGMRTNKPAQGSWFVPGGRVYKDERLDDAFVRITQAELGLTMARRDARFLGVFEHLYDDNALDVPNVSTHYVVLGYEFAIGSADIALPEAQHGAYRWLSERDLMHDPHVHANTRAYFER